MLRAEPMQLNITLPDDFHLHLRDGRAMADVVAHSARVFARAVIMPNLVPPVTTTAQAVSYRDRIVGSLSGGVFFEPLMTLYLTDRTPAEEIETAAASGVVAAVKEVGLKVPLVVRLEGTNVEEGRRVLAESGIDVIVGEGMADAAEKVVAAVGGAA